MAESICATCGGAFTWKSGRRGRPRKHCDSCRRIDVRRRPTLPKPPTTGVCRQCGSPFTGLSSKRYCSRSCLNAARPKISCIECGNPTGWNIGAKEAPVLPRCRNCKHLPCGTRAAYDRGCRCSDCRAAKAAQMAEYNRMVTERDGVSLKQKQVPAKKRTCFDCGVILKSGGHCADGQPRCLKHRAEKNRQARIERYGRQWISNADRYAIYDRDDWICQLCFEPVDRKAKFPDVWSPSLDHIEPRSMALIPDDSPSNLRLVHFWCNSVRGDGTHHKDFFEEAS